MKYRGKVDSSSHHHRGFFVMTSLGFLSLVVMMIMINMIMPCQGTTNPNNDNDEAVFSMLDTDHDDKAFDQDVFRTLQQEDETTRVNIFQKLRESIGLALIGLLLICFAPCVIWKNEGRHVRELARINYCQNEAVVVQDVASPTPDMNQCLVHFSGMVQVDDDEKEQDNTKDDHDKLHVTSRIPHALVVQRTVYIYQKFERAQQSVQQDRLGGGETRTTTYTVQQEWTALGPQAAVLEHVPTETNTRGRWDDLVQATGTNTTNQTPDTTMSPQQVQMQDQLAQMLGMHDVNAPPHRQVIATTARVGGFALSQDIVVAHPKAFLSDWQPVPTEYLPDDIDGLIKGSDNILRTYQEDEHGPQNGDIKIVYEYIPDGFDCSFLVQQVVMTSTDDVEKGKFGVAQCHAVQDHCLGAFSTDLGDVWMVQKGIHDVSTMIDMAKQEEAAMNKVIRIVGWILLLAGWIMLFSPFTTALQVLPILANLGYFAVVLVALIVSVLCCGTITLLAYFRYRPLLSALLLAVAGGIWAIVIWKLDEAAEEGGSVD